MFGDTVTVTTMAGIPDSDDDEEDAAETRRLERELLEEKKRKRAERLQSGRPVPGAGSRITAKNSGGDGKQTGGGASRGARQQGSGVAGEGEGAEHERWSLAAVQKRLAANMPAKSRKSAAKKSGELLRAEKGGKGGKKRKGAGAGAGGTSASALMDKAKGSMPRAELGKGGKKRRKK